MDQTTARLRKTFQYPADTDSDDSLPEALDEQEQESFILNLHQQNTHLNLLYTRILLALPLLSVLLYLPTLFAPHASLLSFLSISSLLFTAYLLFALPSSVTNIPFIDNLSAPKLSVLSSHTSNLLSSNIQDRSPIAQYLPLLNVGLCILLGLLGTVFKGREEVWWGFGWLPMGVYGVVLLAKVVMGSVDPEGELGGLMYGYKGA